MKTFWILLLLAGVVVAANDGDPVSVWTDSSGNGHDGTNTGSVRPTFKSAILNGKPVVRFVAASTQVLNVATPPTALFPWTCLAVVKPTAAGNDLIPLGGSGGTAAAGGMTGSNWYGVDRGGYQFFASTTYESAFHVYSTNASASTTFVFFVDGTSVAATPGGAAANSDNFSIIGNRGTINYSNGDIAEIIFYNVTLSGTNRANLEKYLGTKYGITVAGGTAADPLTVTGLVGWWKADSIAASGGDFLQFF